jgi:hypothetical protein
LAESDNKFVEEQQEQQYQEEYQTEAEHMIESVEQPIESPVVETQKDFEQEKEPVTAAAVEEERHVIDEIEKDLQLQVDTEEADDMDSQLNPDAKEFVPLSPVRNEFSSPPPPVIHENGKSPFINPLLSNFNDDVVSQSPRKNDALIMEDMQVPEENDFDKEANERPHEVNLLEENFQRIESPSELNLKEAMQVDDKLEQEYKDDSQGFFEEEKRLEGEEYKELEKSFSQYSNGFQNKIDDAMNRSFYEGRDSDILADPAKNLLNTTQPLPDDDEPEADQIHVENDKPEVDLLGSGEPQSSLQMESSDNFEVEKFVEEIKGVPENKYEDSGLSPTIPDFLSTQIQTVEETIIATHSPMKEVQENMLETFITQTSAAANIEIPQLIEEPAFEVVHTEIKENIPEEPIEPEMQPAAIQEEPEKVVAEEAKIEEPKSEIIAAAVASGAAVAAVAATASAAVAKKKTPTAGKPDAKKVTDTKAKVPPKSTDVKKAEVKPKAPVSKPASAPARPAVSKTAAITQVKSTVPSSASAASRPKTTTVTAAPAAKKAPLSSAPKPAARPITATTTAPKRPVASTPLTK